MACAGFSATALSDLQAGLHNRPVEEVFDVRVRPTSPQEPWARPPPALPVLPPLSMASTMQTGAFPDVRQNYTFHDVRQNYGELTMADIPGSSVVTYDQHIDVKAEHCEPKALYLKYKAMDPVTRLPSDIVVPAELCLDVFVDPNMLPSPPVEEEESEVEEEDKREEDRRKLKSSIRGDPILLRAGNAPAPEPYFSSTLQDPQQALSQLRIPGRFGGDDARSPGGGAKSSVEGCGTVTSFLKSAGKAKYARPRLDHIDGIVEQAARLAATSSTQSPGSVTEEQSALMGGSPSRGLPLGAVAAPGDDDQRTLAAHVALHLRRVPPLHSAARVPSASSAGGRRRRCGSAAGSDAGPQQKLMSSAEAGDGAESESGGTAAAAAAGGTAEDGEGGDDWPDKGTSTSGALKRRRGSGVSVTSAAGGGTSASAPARPSSKGLLREGSKRTLDGHRRSVGGGAGGTARVGFSTQKVKLRDLDPHISLSAASRAPTQRLHCNWPDGLKRSIARHFYGLSPAKILEEEERERLKEQRPSSRSKESAQPEHTSEEDAAAEEAAAASDLGASTQPVSTSRRGSKVGWLEPMRPGAEERLAQERRMERSIACVDKVPHGLQVRFHANRPGRFVVGRQLQDNTSTERWKLPLSAR